ncbi:dihydrodipicolinate synthase family protein [Paraburkholderia kirstenboschensis]|uniref:Dihydrodipicolinate synthase family protein n=1 Tax=Paraburkholderia kirstenboschensis TaxID=1245436 RepID=A0ABZ0EE90_9BURK|nr:dihydrodipicolinate synthase family protein [Paraburkholderia kirstenboschensis]WOD15543.1 dihydrodipicolinate synthase family protein [Paraburkholderia kirstenboschensis]
MHTIQLPTPAGALERYTLTGTPLQDIRPAAPFNRMALSAAHVVADPFADVDPSSGGKIDWDKTLDYRRYLAGLGLGIAEAMDTAQRGMGLSWQESLQLIRRTRAELADSRVPIFNGCGTDHLDPASVDSLDAVVDAYLQQVDAIQTAGGRLILMASRALARVARSPDDYVSVYRRVLAQVDQPVILHWLGDMFDPALARYWGTDDLRAARDVALQVITESAAKVDGIKVSLLDKQREIDMRRLLPAGVKMYTGDDFNYPELIAGDEQGYSHALLGIFDGIAPAASAALSELAAGRRERFLEILAPTVPLSRHIFRAPTRFYKTGIVFLAFLNGHQSHMTMLAGHQAMRPLPYFVDLFRLADAAGLLRQPELAIARMKTFLACYGVVQD